MYFISGPDIKNKPWKRIKKLLLLRTEGAKDTSNSMIRNIEIAAILLGY
jgi:hypothetical protein